MGKTGEFLAAKQERILVKAIHMHHKVSPNEFENELETNLVIKKRMVISYFTAFICWDNLSYCNRGIQLYQCIYWVCTTITTLGYPDGSFKDTRGRIFAVFWMLLITMSLIHFFLNIIELKFDCRQMALVKLVLAQMTKNQDLEAADLDGDRVVK